MFKILSKIQKKNPYFTLSIFSRAYRRYLRDCLLWKANGGEIDVYRPITNEFTDTAGTASGHYFHQDLLVANFIFKAEPKRHLDIGSRIDGFVAHVASFREIEVLDIRSLPKSPHENILFRNADLMRPQAIPVSDSVSCLHTLEHFGLGRYGDPIAVDGFDRGIANLVSLVDSHGMLYVSFPIGEKAQVQFNAHRILHPNYIFELNPIKNFMTLERFDFVDDNGCLHLDANVNQDTKGLKYGCGIYSFRRF